MELVRIVIFKAKSSIRHCKCEALCGEFRVPHAPPRISPEFGASRIQDRGAFLPYSCDSSLVGSLWPIGGLRVSGSRFESWNLYMTALHSSRMEIML